MSLEEILEDCCDILGQDLEMVKSPQKHQKLVICRTIFCWAACKYKRYSLNEIGEALGGRDHTTVIYSREKAKSFLSVNDDKFMDQFNNYVFNSRLYKNYINK